jgi:hypothetical protein
MTQAGTLRLLLVALLNLSFLPNDLWLDMLDSSSSNRDIAFLREEL